MAPTFLSAVRDNPEKEEDAQNSTWLIFIISPQSVSQWWVDGRASCFRLQLACSARRRAGVVVVLIGVCNNEDVGRAVISQPLAGRRRCPSSSPGGPLGEIHKRR